MSQAEESIEYVSDEDTVAGVVHGDVFVSTEELMVRARRSGNWSTIIGVEAGGSGRAPAAKQPRVLRSGVRHVGARRGDGAHQLARQRRRGGLRRQ